MKGHATGSSNLGPQVKSFFLPSQAAMFFYLVISLLMLTLVNGREVWNLLLGSSVGSISSSDIPSLNAKLYDLQDKLTNLSVLIFWGFLGSVCYGIMWVIQNMAKLTSSEVEQSHLMRGSYAPNKKYWESTIANNVHLVAMIVVWFGYILLYFRLFLPDSSRLFVDGLSSHPGYKGIPDVIFAVIANALALYIFSIINRVLVYSWHVNRPGQ